MLGSNVLPPQYMTWLLPLLALAAGGGVTQEAGVSAALLATRRMTLQVYPVHCYNLLDGRFADPDLLLARNPPLVVLRSLQLALPEKDPR